jgi:predicted nucleic acid-binding protein
MKLLITDTNVLFDVIKIGALPEFFCLDYEICTTEFVINEVRPSAQRDLLENFIRSKKLTVFGLSGDEVDEIEQIDTGVYLKRFTDKSVIWKSLQLKCPILTGDKKMKDVASRLGLEVHGSIWILDSLIINNMISPIEAIDFFEKLKMTNNWLPGNEIERRINMANFNTHLKAGGTVLICTLQLIRFNFDPYFKNGIGLTASPLTLI